ncbi:hypothetical protein [uncultured Rothia sp.]|uniref:VG15 protein n=1 Tax=uncultured Rothia sp. TaxID=316088 RepID=UPI0028E73F3E|nr:hypothetical protein [uncultured Rothia sp.]
MLDDLAAAYAQALAAVADAFVEAFLAALGLIDLSDPAAVKAAEPGMRSLVVKHRRLAAQAANAFLDASAAEHGVEAYHPPVELYHASALRKLLRENVGASAEQLAAAARRHVVMAGHRQMMRAVLDPEFGNYATREEQEELERSTSPLTAGDESEDDAPAGGGKVRPVGWARVLQGKYSCGFCIMLASRGPVYSSADAAKYVAAPVGEKSREGGFLSRKARTELRKKNPRAFHEHCDCIVVPVFDPENWSGRAEQQRLAKFYRDTVEKEDRKYEADPEGYEPVKISTVLSREAEAWQEAERLDGKEEQVDPKYYGALASEIPDGEKLYGHELLFLLRFEALGNKARWIERPALIPGAGRKPSNDFVWLNNGELISELKSSKNKYSTIKVRISQAVSKAREQGVVKENFVVDLGKHRMGATLKQQMQSYNFRNPQNRIKNLYVLHGNGQYLDHIMFD